MEKDDLKQLWQQENALQEMKGDVIDESIIRQKNRSAAAKIVRKQKWKMGLLTAIFIILLGGASYLLLFKEPPKTSLKLIVVVALGFIPPLFRMITEISVLRLMHEITDSENIKESTLRLKQKLDRIKAFQFGMYIIFSCGWIILLVTAFVQGEIKEPIALMFFIILAFILLPWLSKRDYNKQFKALSDKLDMLIDYLNNG